MKGTIKAHGHYFCSENCIRKYEEKHDISEKDEYCPSCQVNKGRPWYREKLTIITFFSIIILILSYTIDQLNPFFNAFIDYLNLIWWAILLGFLLGGVIDYFIPREYIKKYLSRHKKRTIFYSILFGFLMSACSHGILAVAMELYKKGASTSSVIAFLMASPWANLPITFLLVGFFGLKAFYIILSALIIATTTGLIFQALERKGWVECRSCKMGEDTPVLQDFSIKDDIKKRWKNYEFNFKNNYKALAGVLRGSWSLTKMVMWWLIIGMLMASFARAYIPTDLFQEYMGPTLLGLAVTLLFATIIEVCSEGSAPLAFEIFNKTGAFGNSFTFLMAGVASDYTEIGLIWHNIGKKAALWLPLVSIPQILFLGFIFNIIT
ncbi:MAG: permease [Candidatus Thermoplasmatota archaeon]